ncbi:MAG TPA: PilZ domain-containing protein [Bryobacteraceae bacterium]|nr:PilZ domain-containing protein [Bryobacteraceae bacterium]
MPIDTGEMRRQDRMDVAVPVDVMWTDRQGHERFATALSIDVCESGLRIQVPEALPERSYVRLRADRIALAGSASVRTCVKKGTKFLVGLEFSGGMTWKRPVAAKAQEIPMETPRPIVR